MTRTSLNWAVPLSVLALAIACGSSGNKAAGVDGDPTTVGGTSSYSEGGTSANAGNGTSGDGTSGDGTSGNGINGGEGSGNAGAANAGSGNGTAGENANAGAGAISTNGGDGNGGDGNGGDGTAGDAVNGGAAGSDSTGGQNSQDVLITGGGNSDDVGTGGGTSVDMGTGGGETLDGATGGSSSLDIPTGGGSSVDIPTGGGSSVDIPTGGSSSVDIPTGGAPSFDVLNCVETVLTDINVYVIKEATPSGADTEGNMYVGGNLTSTGSYTVGLKNPTDCDHYSLVVGGNISISGGSVNGGRAVYGGTSAKVEAVSFKCGDQNLGLERGRPIDFAALESQVKALSTKMTTLTANGTATSGSGGQLILKGTDPKLNVFNISASDAGNVTIDVPTTSSVIVNVSGKTVNWPGSKMVLPGGYRTGDDYEFATNVVWNFYEATSITIGGVAFQGSILAPYATIEDGSGGHVAGQVIVENLKGGTEYHPYYFSGCITWQNL